MTRAALLVAFALVSSGAARAQDVASDSSSGVVGLTIEGDHGILDEVRIGGMARAGVLGSRRLSPRVGDLVVAAPTRAQLSLDLIFRQDVTVRASAAWNGTLGALPSERPRTGKEDRIALEELFVEARNIASTPLWARVGRQPIARGRGMILGEDLDRSRITHDAALVAWETPTVVLQVYWERLARRGRPGIDGGAWSGAIDSGGPYLTKRFADELGLDLYAIYFRDRSPREPIEDRATVGARAFGRAFDLLEYSLEGALQYGARGSGPAQELIAAYGAEAMVSLDLRRAPLAPRITAEAGFASGDKNPSDGRTTTFDPLYEDGHGRFGLSDVVLLENLRAVGLRVSVRPTESLLFEVSCHGLWVDEPADASAPRLFARRGRPTSSRELGRDFSVRVRFDPRDELVLEAGAGFLVPGAYARAKLESAAVLGNAFLLVEVRF